MTALPAASPTDILVGNGKKLAFVNRSIKRSTKSIPHTYNRLSAPNPPEDHILDRLFSGLTDAQREAVTHVEGPLLILAGPGSGKTRVVTHRVAWLLQQGISGHHILALTFTNKAAGEMSFRIQRLSNDPSVWVGTFHRFCARLLRQYAPLVGLQQNYTIYDVSDSVRALRQAVGRMKIDLDRYPPESLARAISWAKNNVIGPDQYQPRPGHALGNIVQKVYPAYQHQLTISNAVDFDDLLLHVAAILRDNPEIRASLDERHRFILLDEYQDTNLAQYAIARACRSIIPIWPSPATPISRSTAGAGPMSTTFLSSSTTTPTCASFAWSKTTAARNASCESRPS